jgi:hypothetical protein
MQANSTLKLNHMLKKSLISFTMIGVVALALASNGGGEKNAPKAKAEYSTARTLNGLTMKAGPIYSGSRMYSTQRQSNFVMYSSVLTYRKGNTTYILPYKYKMNTRPTLRSNMQVLDLKIKLNK